MDAVIELQGVSKSYQSGSARVWALKGIDLAVGVGELVVFSGKSGCGKTTLLNLVGGLDVPSAGEVRVAGRNIGSLSEKDRTLYRRDEVGTVFQFFHLIPMLTVEENIALPHWLAGFPEQQTRLRVEVLLEQMELRPRRKHHPHELSGGEQQRVAIARALVNSPRIILADEPTGNLDSLTGGQVLSLLLDLNRHQGQTILMATHSREADPLASRIVKLKDGQIQEIIG
ncbi:MAG: ABC transporter ATP-binding protein [Deltaproteobacteria bacterium]|nr:ABC transporter ATP-binding protein [Deltaproteobacteria bacterium]